MQIKIKNLDKKGVPEGKLDTLLHPAGWWTIKIEGLLLWPAWPARDNIGKFYGRNKGNSILASHLYAIMCRLD